MLITGITPDKFRTIVSDVGNRLYNGNLRAEIGAEYTRLDGTCRRFRARVIPLESGATASYAKTGHSAPGARRSWAGRRTKAACWHSYRDVLAQLFDVNPHASVRTAMATYLGREGFYDQFPRTANQNIGSMMAPAYMPDLCDCPYWFLRACGLNDEQAARR